MGLIRYKVVGRVLLLIKYEERGKKNVTSVAYSIWRKEKIRTQDCAQGCQCQIFLKMIF